MAAEFGDLEQRLFAAVTAMLEDSIAAAVAGQSSHLTAAARMRYAGSLQTALRDVAVVAEAIQAIGRFERANVGGRLPAKRR